MNVTDIAKICLMNQHVGLKRRTSVQELVSHMGALQAQDYEKVKWVMGVQNRLNQK
jgi:hypothetical protein